MPYKRSVFTLIFSVLIGEWISPRFGMERNAAMLGIYGIVTLVSLVLSILYFRKVKISSDDPVSREPTEINGI